MALVEVSPRDLSSKPARQIVLVSAKFSDGSSTRGTGVLVGPNDILTAGHVVYSQRQGWMDGLELWFVADYNPTTRQLETTGEFIPWNHWTATAWPNQIYASAPAYRSTPQETQFDAALIGIDYAVGTELGFLSMNEGFNQTGVAFDATAYGYSSGFSALTRVQTTAVKYGPSASMYTIDQQLFAGASGGPLLTNRNEVIGVVSAGSSKTGTQFADLSLVWDELVEVYHQNDSLLPTWSQPSWNLELVGKEDQDLPTQIVEGESLGIKVKDSHHVADRVSIRLTGISERDLAGPEATALLSPSGLMHFGHEFTTTLLFTTRDAYELDKHATIHTTFYDDDSGYQQTISETFSILDRLTLGSTASRQFQLNSFEYETSLLIEAAFGQGKIQHYLADGMALMQARGTLQSTIEALVETGLIESEAGPTNEDWVSHVYNNISPPLQNLPNKQVFVAQLATGISDRADLLAQAVHTLVSWDGALVAA